MAHNPLRLDPTRTTMARRAFVADMTRRFRKIRKAMFQLIVEEDAFALKPKNQVGAPLVDGTVRGLDRVLTGNVRWKFERDDGKIDGYRAWLQQQVDDNLLETTLDGAPWTQQYVQPAYKKGMVRAWQDTKMAKKAAGASFDFIEGGKEGFLEMAFAGPVGQGKLRTLGTRNFTQLKGITAEMDKEMSAILAQGLASGDGAEALARKLDKSLTGIERKRARTLARTEIIHAHSEGQLDAFEAMNIEGVGVMAEWSTAGDSLVCPLCQPLEGVVLTIEEARGMLPRHPNCRCAWIPANVGEEKGGTTTSIHSGPEQGLSKPGTKPTGKKFGQVHSKDEIKARLRESIKAEHPKLPAKQARIASRWQGADVTVAGKLKPGSKAFKTAKAGAVQKRIEEARKAAAAAVAKKAEAAAAHSAKIKAGIAKAKAGKFDVAPLTKVDRGALNEYQSGLFKSETGGFSTIQRVLREGTVPKHLQEQGVTVARVRAIVDDLDVAIGKSVLSEDTVVLRGVQDAKLAFAIDDMKKVKPGFEFTDDAFGSTTSSRKVADKFAIKLNPGEEPRVLHIQLKKGQKAFPMDRVNAIGEKEIVLPRGTRYRVTRVSGKNVHLEIVEVKVAKVAKVAVKKAPALTEKVVAARKKAEALPGWATAADDLGVKMTYVDGTAYLDQATMERLLQERGIAGWGSLTKGGQDKLLDLRSVKGQLEWLIERDVQAMSGLLRAQAKRDLQGFAVRDRVAAATKARKFKGINEGIATARAKPKLKWKKIKNAKEFEKQATKDFAGLRSVTVNKNKTGALMVDQLNEAGEDMARMYNEHPNIRVLMDLDDRTSTLNFERKVVYNGKKKDWNGAYAHDVNNSDMFTTNRRSIHANGNLQVGSKSWVTEDGWNATTRHEFGHYVQYRFDIETTEVARKRLKAMGAPGEGDWAKVLKKLGGKSKSAKWKQVSQYGSFNSREMFAESYATWTHAKYGMPKPRGTPGGSRLPKVIEEYMSKLTGKKIPPRV